MPKQAHSSETQSRTCIYGLGSAAAHSLSHAGGFGCARPVALLWDEMSVCPASMLGARVRASHPRPLLSTVSSLCLSN